MFSLELTRRSDSNEHTKHTTFNIKKKIPLNIPNIIMSAAIVFFSRDSRTSSK